MVYERWFDARAYYKYYMCVDLVLLAGYAASLGLLWYMGQADCMSLRSQQGSLHRELLAGWGSINIVSSLANIDKVTCMEMMVIYAVSWINIVCLVFSAFFGFKRRNTMHEKTRRQQGY